MPLSEAEAVAEIAPIGLADQLTEEIAALLEDHRIRRALEARAGRLIIDWANGHVTYCEPQPRYKIGADLRLGCALETSPV